MKFAYLGLDPSISGTGVAAYFPHMNRFMCHKFARASSKVLDFDAMYLTSVQQMTELQEFLQEYGAESKSALVIQEAPPPIGQHAPGLFAVGTAFRFFWDCRDVPVISVHPSRIKQLTCLGKRYDKSDVPPLVQEILELNAPMTLIDHVTQSFPKRLKSDPADALFLLLYLLYNHAFEIKLPQKLDAAVWLLKEENRGL